MIEPNSSSGSLAGRLAAALQAALAVWRGEPRGSADPPPPAPLRDALLPAFVDALGLPVALVSADGRLLAVSEAARALLPALAPGTPLGLVLREPAALAAIDRATRDREPAVFELVERTPPERTLRLRIAPFDGGARPLLALSIEDLSEMKTVERMRVDFVANASHELRTPLATLLGFIETLQGAARDDAAARGRFLAIMAEQARRMSRLIDDLLSLSRIEQRAHLAPNEPVDLVAITREIIDSLSVMAAERGVAVAGPDIGRPVIVSGARDELLRLVENLVENAIKYGQSGKKVEVALAVEDDRAVLAVRDYGPGIPREHIPRLTERFYRVDVGQSREAGGTGLGLAIVKHILLRHRGRLNVESRLGEGSTFRVTLPLRRPP